MKTKKRATGKQNPTPVPHSLEVIKLLVANTMEGLHKGTVDAKDARAIAQLMPQWIALEQMTTVERRMTQIEAMIAAWKPKDPDVESLRRSGVL